MTVPVSLVIGNEKWEAERAEQRALTKWFDERRMVREQENIKEKETLLIVQESRKCVVLCWAPWAPV